MDALFETQEIFLRPFEATDQPALQSYLNHPGLAGCRYLPMGIQDYSPLSGRQVDQVISEWNEAQKSIHLAVCEKDSTFLVGHAECDWEWDPHCPSLALVISPKYQRRGYGTQVLSLLLRYLFEFTTAHTVTVWINDWNAPVMGFFEHWGFHSAGRMRRAGVHHGQYTDLMVLDLLRREWQAGMGGQHGA